MNEGLILVAEDREDDQLLIRRAFERAQLVNPLRIVNDGEEAIAYLKGEGQFSDRTKYPLPELLLLDLKMPRKNGFEVLEWVRSQPDLKVLPVVVLTSSEDVYDVSRAYQLGANSFLVKPIEFDQFVQMSKAIKGYWLWLSRPPAVPTPPAFQPLEKEGVPEGSRTK
jgi:CheY-like chemotaxis protein